MLCGLKFEINRKTQVETLPLFNANTLCAGSGTPTPAPGGDSFTVGGGGDPTQAF